jgi:ELWxxDGT repeat protein
MPAHVSSSGSTIEPLEGRRLLALVPLVEGLRAHLASGSATLDGYTYFQGHDAAHGLELWRTDGTAAGTTLVKDIEPRVDGSFAYSSIPTAFMVFNGAVLFSAIHLVGNDSHYGLFRTDGTEAGTQKLADIVSWNVHQYREGWYPFGGKLVGLGAQGLIATDGTAPGTELLVGSPQSSSLVGTADRLYWLSSGDRVVFSYDGTTATTVASAPAGAEDPMLTSRYGTGVVYDYRVRASTGWSRQRVTLAPREQVVRPLTERFPNYDNHDDFEFGGMKFYNDDQGNLVRRGTDAGRDVVLHKITRGSLTVARDTLFFTDFRQLWTTDGTRAGTRLVRDFASHATGPRYLVGTRGALYFAIEEAPNVLQPWRSDGTEPGTVRAAQIDVTNPTGVTLFGLARHGTDLLVGARDRLYLLPTGRPVPVAAGLDAPFGSSSPFSTLRVGADEASSDEPFLSDLL